MISSGPGATDRVVIASLVLSGLLAIALGGAYFLSHSRLALAQAADSLADVLTSGALLWALRVSQRPPDANHPFGHQSAQPVAALVVSVLVGVLAVEVLVGSVETLVRGSIEAALAWPLAAGPAVKVAAKLVLLRWARHEDRGAVLQAFRVDARNDVLIGLVSLCGYAAARYGGYPTIDAWLALPIAAWIFASGIGLGLDNLRLLMGTAPPHARQQALAGIAAEVDGVRRVVGLKARHHGPDLYVWLEIHVDAGLSVAAGHDIGEAVELRILEEPDVCDVVVHVDAEIRGDEVPVRRQARRRSRSLADEAPPIDRLG